MILKFEQEETEHCKSCKSCGPQSFIYTFSHSLAYQLLWVLLLNLDWLVQNSSVQTFQQLIVVMSIFINHHWGLKLILDIKLQFFVVIPMLATLSVRLSIIHNSNNKLPFLSIQQCFLKFLKVLKSKSYRFSGYRYLKLRQTYGQIDGRASNILLCIIDNTL